MIFGKLDSNIAYAQLQNIFGLEEIFKRRGLEVASHSSATALPFKPSFPRDQEKCYQELGSRSLRRILAAVSASPQGLSFKQVKQVVGYIKLGKVRSLTKTAVDLGFLFRPKPGEYASEQSCDYAKTFEWFVATVCAREFGCITYWGAKVNDLTGDYDVVVVRENQLGYVECKSGKAGNIGKDQVENFLIRERLLAPRFSIFLVDGSTKNSINHILKHILNTIPQFEYRKPGGIVVLDPHVEEYKLFYRIYPNNIFVLPIGSKITTPLRAVFRFMAQVTDRSWPYENLGLRSAAGFQRVIELRDL